MKNHAKITLPVVILLALVSVAVPAGAMVNPSAIYCNALGYQYTDMTGSDGSMTGFCLLPGNRSVDAWQFLEGNVSPDYGYCKKQGLDVRVVTDPAVCGMLGSTCAVCVRADGTTQEVTKMMGLDFREKICSGNTCCDPAKDKTCLIGQEPSGVAGSNDWLPLVLVLVAAILVIAGIAYFLRSKNKTNEPEKKNP